MALRSSIFVFAVTGFALAFPPRGFADDKSKDAQAGGSAAEHRSDQAGEKSNAQWSDQAEKGQERAAQPSKGEASKGKAKHAGSEKHAAPKKGGTAKHGSEKHTGAKEAAPKHGTAKHGTAPQKSKPAHEPVKEGAPE